MSYFFGWAVCRQMACRVTHRSASRQGRPGWKSSWSNRRPRCRTEPTNRKLPQRTDLDPRTPTSLGSCSYHPCQKPICRSPFLLHRALHYPLSRCSALFPAVSSSQRARRAHRLPMALDLVFEASRKASRRQWAIALTWATLVAGRRRLTVNDRPCCSTRYFLLGVAEACV